MAWLTVQEAAELLRVPVSWLYERTRTNSVPHVKLGKYLRFDRDELNAWLEELKRDGTGSPAIGRPDAVGNYCISPSRRAALTSQAASRICFDVTPTDQRVLREKGGTDLGAIRKRGKQYAIRYYDAAGRRRWETIGPNLHEAKQVLAERMWERRNGKFRLSRKPITVKEFVKKWDDDYVTTLRDEARPLPRDIRPPPTARRW